MSILESQILERVRALQEDQQREVLEFVDHLAASLYPTAVELMNMPPDERERHVSEAFAHAADFDFETFEAYSEENPISA